MSAENAIIMVRVDELTDLLQNLATSPWLKLDEAATFARCSVRKIEQLVAAGKLPCHRSDPSLAKSTRLIHRKHLITFIITGKNAKKQRLSSEEHRLVQELL